MAKPLHMLLIVIAWSTPTSGMNDMDFKTDISDSLFSFYDFENTALDTPGLTGGHQGLDAMAGVDLDHLDTQIESSPYSDFDVLLEELKGYHGLSEDGKSSVVSVYIHTTFLSLTTYEQ